VTFQIVTCVTYDAIPIGWQRYALDPADIKDKRVLITGSGTVLTETSLVNRPYQLPATVSFLGIHAERYTPQWNKGLKCYFTIFIIHNVKGVNKT